MGGGGEGEGDGLGDGLGLSAKTRRGWKNKKASNQKQILVFKQCIM